MNNKEDQEQEIEVFSAIKSRRKAREAALQALYQCETLGDWSAGAIHNYFEVFHNLEVATLGARDGAIRFCMEVIEGVVLYGVDLDKIISTASVNWTLARMSRVDRNILRIACFELCFLSDVPTSVTLNEALDLAKEFGSEESAKFVNGVLDRIINMPELKDRYPAFAERSLAVATV